MPVVVAIATIAVSAQSASRGYDDDDDVIVWYGSAAVGLVSKMFLTFRKGVLSLWDWNSFADPQAS